MIRNTYWLKDIFEKQPGINFTFANCGAFKLTQDIFKEKIIYGSGRSGSEPEEWLSSMVGSMAKKKPIRIVQATRWFPIATVEDINKVDKSYTKR